MGDYLAVIFEIFMKPKHFQSDFARQHSSLIAEAASRGHITSVIHGMSKG